MMGSRNQVIAVLTLIIITVCTISFTLQSCKQNTSGSKYSLQVTDNAFVGPDACQSCHAKEYADWSTSDHFKAMMVANDSSVSGDFNNASLNSDGVYSKFFKRDEKFYINTEGDDGKNHDYEVKFTFGYYPLQQYLVEFPGGRMQVPRQSYNVVTKKWFHQYSGHKINHHDWMHWTKQSQNWNSMCANCHSTGLQRNYDEASDSYHTTYTHINVSCESCHGMGKNHIAYINTDEYKEGAKSKGSYLLLAKDQKSNVQLSACVQCHARRMEISSQPIASTEILDNYIPETPTTENYFPDGQFHNEDYEYGSFTQSKMYHRDVKCNNCHNPHSGKLKLEGNKLCLQCHQPKYNSPEHYFHETNTAAAECISCHMPSRIYMGADTRRDHSMRIPRPDQSVKYNTPNACNQCHSNKTSQWSADAIIKWYGKERKYYYTDDLIPGSQLDENSFYHLNKLVHDTTVSEMIRATAINYMGEIVTEGSLSEIKYYLTDSSAMVRHQAVTSLANFPPERWAASVSPLLVDPVRAIRIAAANSLSGVPKQLIDNNRQTDYAAANNELLQFLHFQSDFATGNIMLADYYSRTGENSNAEKYYLRTLKIDSMANYARINLATIYNTEGKNGKAIEILNAAYKTDRENPRISYNLALIYVEVGNKEDALKYFDNAHRLKYGDPQLYYNYGLYLQQAGNSKKAQTMFSEGLKLFENSEKLTYGASYFYLQTGQKEKAFECIRKLQLLNPSNPNYRELFKLIN